MKATLKKSLALVLCALVAFGSFAIGGFELPKISSFTAFAEPATSTDAVDSGVYGGNIKWEYGDGILTVTREVGAPDGIMAEFLEAGIPGWRKYDSSINSIYFTNNSDGEGVESICTRAFTCMSELESVFFSGSVEKIGSFAFENCQKMEVKSWPYYIEEIDACAFKDCRALSGIDVPGYIGKIGYRAFYNCESLKSIKVTGLIDEIGEEAFYYCNALESIVFPGGAVKIGPYAFRSCSNLQSVEVTGSLEEIGEGAFYDCKAFSSIRVPGCLRVIGDLAFYECSSLSDFNTTYNIPEDTEEIGELAFYRSGISRIKIPPTTTVIGDGAFAECSSLEAIDCDSFNNNYCSVDGILYNKDRTVVIAFPAAKSSVKNAAGNVYITPETVTEFADWAFAGCFNIKSICIPVGFAKTGDNTFNKFDSLKDVYYLEGTDKDSIVYAENSSFDLANWHRHEHKVEIDEKEIPCSVGKEFPGTMACGYNMTEYRDGVGHDLDEATEKWEWSEDRSKCTFTATCKRCGETVTIDAKVTSDVKAATCEEAGYENYTATFTFKGKDYENKNDKAVPAKGHDAQKVYEVVKAATCTEKGQEKRICNNCHKIITVDTDAKGHKKDSGKIVKEPTCYEVGQKVYTCTVCKATETEDIPMIPHVLDEGTVTKEPTCTENGEKVYRCINDGCDYYETESLGVIAGVEIVGYQRVIELAYKTRITFHATVYNMTSLSEIVWVNDDNEIIGRGDTLTVYWGDVKDDFTVQAIATYGGTQVKSEPELVRVSHSFLDALIWFFGHIFNPRAYVLEQTEDGIKQFYRNR